MQAVSDVSNAVLRRLHAEAVYDPALIRSQMQEACASRLTLQGRRTVRGEAEQARIQSVEDQCLVLRTSNLSQRAGSRVLLTFSIGGRSYSFSALAIDDLSRSVARIEVPTVLYVVERRDRRRRVIAEGETVGAFVHIRSVEAPWSAEAMVSDYSDVGLNVRLHSGTSARPGEAVEVSFSSGDLAGSTRWGQVRHVEARTGREEWTRVGLAMSEARHAAPLDVEKRLRITRAGTLQRMRNGISVMSAGAASAGARILSSRSPRSPSEAIEIVDFTNSRGERIRGVLDRTNFGGPVTGVVIPPAWGRTKETLLPLALTIVETFRKAGEGVAVLRFDGTRRRGESHKDPGCEDPGNEHLTFAFSDAVEDIISAARFLTQTATIDCLRVVLITFSAASIEGRRAVLLDSGDRFAGWVSVVGTPDLQSGLRAVSGGIDYVGGAEQGVAFGVQEIMGVPADVDRIMGDAIRNRLPFLEDARRDMEAIRIPVAWIHGAHDGWIDLERVREIMGCGDTSRRRLIEVPTGHQLRSSLEALEVFQLVAEEAASIATGRPMVGALPNLKLLEAKRLAERARLPKPLTPRVRDFWRDYLVGRDGKLGIELMNASGAYAELMRAQIDGLELSEGDRVADVGSGTGSFPLALLRRDDVPNRLEIDEIDFVEEAHVRARTRLRESDRWVVRFETCNLENEQERRRVFSPAKYDAVLLSLVLGYLADPLGVLRDIRSSMRTSGRLVVSSMRKDADISRLFVESLGELRAGRAREAFGDDGESVLQSSVRSFLNDAARILDFEESGVFRFLDVGEIQSLLKESGFEATASLFSFGDPPQAIVLVARPALT